MSDRPRLYSVYFGEDRYVRLAKVLKYTAGRHCRGWNVDVAHVDPTTLRAASQNISHANNSWKLEFWRDAVLSSPDGARLLLVDSDTFVNAPLDPLWGIPFDLAYTGRDQCNFPLNAGVIAVRVNPRTRAAMSTWFERDRAFLADFGLHSPWRKAYGGINQASFGSLLEGGAFAALGVDVVRVPCREWNAENTCWNRPNFNLAAARIVHVKSALRLAVFGESVPNQNMRATVNLWRTLERQADAIASGNAIAYNKN
jgi:hypothetical protein